MSKDEANDSAILTEASETSDKDDNLTTSCPDSTNDGNSTNNNVLKRKLETFQAELVKEINNLHTEKEQYKKSLDETVDSFVESIQTQRNCFYEKIDEFYSKKKIKLQTSLHDVQPLQKLSLSINQGIIDHINDMVSNFIDKTQNQINKKIEFKKSSVLNKGSIGYLKEISFERKIFKNELILNKIPKKLLFVNGKIFSREDDFRLVDVESERCIAESESNILDVCCGRNFNLIFVKHVDDHFKYVEVNRKSKKPKEKKLFHSPNPSNNVLIACIEEELIIMDLEWKKYYLYDLSKKIIERFELDDKFDYVNVHGIKDCFYATTDKSILSFDCLGITSELNANFLEKKPSLFSRVIQKLLDGEDIIKGGDILYIIKRYAENEERVWEREGESSGDVNEEITAVNEQDIFPGKHYEGHQILLSNQIKFLLSDKINPKKIYIEIYAIN